MRQDKETRERQGYKYLNQTRDWVNWQGSGYHNDNQTKQGEENDQIKKTRKNNGAKQNQKSDITIAVTIPPPRGVGGLEAGAGLGLGGGTNRSGGQGGAGRSGGHGGAGHSGGHGRWAFVALSKDPGSANMATDICPPPPQKRKINWAKFGPCRPGWVPAELRMGSLEGTLEEQALEGILEDTINCDTIKFAVNWYSSDCDCSDSSDLLKSQWNLLCTGLIAIFLFVCNRSCVRDPSQSIAARLKEMSEIFLQNYEGTGDDNNTLARGVHVHTYLCHIIHFILFNM